MAPATDDLAPRHFAKIVDSSDDAIVSKDLNGIILSWNAAAERMFGYTLRKRSGSRSASSFRTFVRARKTSCWAQIRAGKAVRHYETVRQRKDGTLIPISLTVSPIHNDDRCRHRRFEDRSRHHGAGAAARDGARAGGHLTER